MILAVEVPDFWLGYVLGIVTMVVVVIYYAYSVNKKKS